MAGPGVVRGISSNPGGEGADTSFRVGKPTCRASRYSLDRLNASDNFLKENYWHVSIPWFCSETVIHILCFGGGPVSLLKACW